MSANNFKQRADILMEGSGDEAMLYHPENDELHVLNPTAQLIWQLCDGQQSVADMVAAMRTQFAAAPEADLQADIEQTLAEFRQKDLLQL